MTTAGETVSLRIPVWAREAIIHLAWSLTASDSTELLESVNAALHLDLTRHGSTHAAVSADHLMALQVIADHVLTVCPQSERQGWAQFRAAVQDGQATLSNEIAWRMETIYQHVVAVRSTWVVQPSGSKCRVRGVRVSMASRTSSFVCWVEAGNGRKLGVMPDTNQRYGRESLNLRFEADRGYRESRTSFSPRGHSGAVSVVVGFAVCGLSQAGTALCGSVRLWRTCQMVPADQLVIGHIYAVERSKVSPSH